MLRKTSLLVALAFLGSFATVGPAAAAKPPSSDGGASGNLSLTVHAHSSQFTDTLFPTSPVPFPVTEPSSGTYSSIPCSRPAPFNDTALDFTPDFPGVEDPASVRHFVEVALTPTQGNKGTIEGEITTILCVDGEESENQLFITFAGTYKQTAGEVRFKGTFEITGGTGVFEDITGEGAITGTLTCLASRNATCAQLGVLSDAVFSLQGSFSDPTV
jgi:hypothetical protein